jgi:hypothetical protein
MVRKKSQKGTKKSRSASSAKVSLTAEEKQIALAELGVSPAALSGETPTWPYLVGGLLVLGSLVLSVRLVTR